MPQSAARQSQRTGRGRLAEGAVIDTTRLRLVPLSERHLTARYVGWLNDPEVVRYSDQRHCTHTLTSCRRYWRSFAGSPHYLWAVEARDPRLGHIGNISAHVDPIHRVADVGILIGERAVWRCGYGAEAWIAVCRYLLRIAGMRKISAGTLASHAAMLGVMRRAGMVGDGRRVRHRLVDDHAVDVIHMALFREQLDAR